MRLRVLPIIALAGVFALPACGSDKPAAAPASTAASVATSQPASTGTSTGADFNDADTAFAQGMIPHHQQAVQMAAMALDPAADSGAKVKDLATRIKAAQGPEIETMTGWLAAWGQPMTMGTTAGTDMGGMGGMSGTDGMMSTDEMTALGKLTGAEFDKTWTEMMIRHHQGAITMSEKEKTDGSNADALALAGNIATAQQAEITEMQALLAG
jgi:uncharacterized protein (DUF305 family)